MWLSEHFTRQEFEVSQTAEREELDNTIPTQLLTPMMELCAGLLEPIRNHYGPVIISSGYRSPDLNRAIHGSTTSQHCKGEAADIIIPGKIPLEVCRWIEDANLPYDQLIYEGRWTHISYSAKIRRQTLTAVFETGHAPIYLKGLQDV